MPRPQTLAHAVRDLDKLPAVANVQGAFARQGAVDDVGDPPRTGRHHHDLGGQVHRLGDRMGDKADGLSGALPKLQQLFVRLYVLAVR